MNHHGIADEFMVLALSLHGERIGHLAGYKNGRNVLVFDEGFQGNLQRPTLSLITHPNFPRAAQFLSRRRLPAFACIPSCRICSRKGY